MATDHHCMWCIVYAMTESAAIALIALFLGMDEAIACGHHKRPTARIS
jgi:hypothetical protein